MTALYYTLVVNYALLALAALVLARAHYHAAERARVVALVFIAAVLGIEAVQHAMTVWAWLHAAPPTDARAMGAVAIRASLSWLRLGLTWGLLLGVRFGTLGLGDAHGLRGASRLTWQGYRGYCADLWCRAKARIHR